MANSSPVGFSLGIAINSLVSETACASMAASTFYLLMVESRERMMPHLESFVYGVVEKLGI